MKENELDRRQIPVRIIVFLQILICSQALAVCKLILQYMPEFEIKQEDLRMFPEAIIADAIKVLDGSDLPPGYGE